MRAHFIAILTSALLFTAAGTAQAEDVDDIVRLPGQGLMKPGAAHGASYTGKPQRLVPGGGLMVSFDGDANGRITPLELMVGAEAAFLQADTNKDGTLSAFEQIAWADGLPTHDDTLSNPVRFDPNLDRMVSYDEFRDVISSLAADYASETGEILVSALLAPKRKQQDEPAFTRLSPAEQVNPR